MKPILVLITPLNELSPNEGPHPKHVVQSMLNQDLKYRPVDVKVIGTVSDTLMEEIRRFDVDN